MRIAAIALVTLTLSLGCDGDAPLDAGVDGGADAGALDAGRDGGPPGPRHCGPCRRNTDCGEGAVCMLLADGSRGCGQLCATDAECAGLSPTAACLEEDVGLPRVCLPTAGTCVVSSPGAACATEPCEGRFDTCADLNGLGPICTSRCASDADCPIGMRRCRETDDGRLCVPDESAAPERCALLVDAGLATACEADGSCPGGGACFGGSLRLCLEDAAGGCPDGTSARVAPTGEEVCVPSLPDWDGWAAQLALDCECVLEDPGAMLDEALGVIGRDRCQMTFPRGVLDGFEPALSRDPYRLSWTDRAHRYWPAALTLAEHVGARLDAAADGDRPASDALREAARLADLHYDEATDADSADLVEALARLIEAGGEAPDRDALATEASALPAPLATALTPIVDALRRAVIAREAAVARLVESEREDLFDGASLLALSGRGLALAQDSVRGSLRGDVDVGQMAGGAIGVLAAIEAADLPSLVADAAMTVQTPWGVVAVRGTSDDTYDAAEWDGALLLVDLGGDDTYRYAVGATASPTHGVGVAVDVGGVDEYGYAPVADPLDDGPPGHRRLPSDGLGRARPTANNGPSSESLTSRQGAGRLGVGLLLDLGVEGDRYRSLRMSQGWGGLGIGVLYDRAGDDVYEGESGVQGGAAFGVGLLIDGDGGDEYVTYHAAQGFAYARAVGVLHDDRGDDTYLSVVDDVLYVSPQDRTSNSSFTQGAGFGRRADFSPDRTFMSGGLGVLRDRRGQDRYTAGVFAQATGFWFGAGMLLEGGGDDHYDGVWYVQSGSAHYAISVLLEAGGTDDYNQLATRRNVAMAGGHDFSIAWFVERAGDDVYRAPGISFGGGNEAGAGIFADLAGVDRYDATNNRSFGWAGIDRPGEDTGRMTSGTVGIFLEADGVDTYARPEVGDVANDASWEQSRNSPDEGERGVGLDRTGGRTGLE